MNTSKGIATFWLLVMITIIKVFSIIFLCSLNIDVEKLMLQKHKDHMKIPPILLNKSKHK